MSKIVTNAQDLEAIQSTSDGRVGIGTTPFTDAIFHLKNGNVGLEFSLDHSSGGGLNVARLMTYDRTNGVGRTFQLTGSPIRLNDGIEVDSSNNVKLNGYGVIGYNQTWQNPARSAGVTYTNSTGRPIEVMIDCYVTASTYVYVIINGQSVCYPTVRQNFTFIVPPGHTYIVEQNVIIYRWWELR